MKKTYMTLLLAAAVALSVSAAAPNGSGTYYQAADGKKAAALKTALCSIVQTTVEREYGDLWTDFKTTDKRSDGKVWDMYSNITNFTFGTDQAGSYQKEGDVYNREHSFPKSWFGGEIKPMYTDLHHMYPTDGFVNNKRGNYPFGEVSSPTYSSSGDFSKLGPCSYSGYTGTVFEPADEYKGDFARTYFYMVTRYEEKLSDWYSKNSESRATLDGSTYPAFQTWQLNMLMEWATNDPVSEKETNRNNAVYGIQNNRNPFIDYPGLEQYIWGSKKNDAFSYDNYVQPDGSSSGSSGSGDDPDPGTDPNPGGSGTYKLTITLSDFVTGGYAANNSEKTSQAVCTTDANKTYEVKWTSNQVMLQSNAIQWQKNAGYIYNSTDLGTITSVTVTSSAGTFTTYYGTSPQPSSSTTVGGGYFRTVVGNATGTSSKIEVVFTIGSGDEPVDPSFNNLSDVSVTYGSTLTLTKGTTGTPNFVTDGTVTLSSLNENVVTVDGLTITPVAVGTTMISVSTAATDAYNAGSVMFPITVNAPEGGTEAKPSTGGETDILLFGESFGINDTSNARDWDNSYSVKFGIEAVYSGISGYTTVNARQGKNGTGTSGSGLNQKTQNTDASIIMGPLNVADYFDLRLTYQWKAGSIGATYFTKAYYATSSTGTYTELIGTGTGATTFVERSYTLPAAAQVSTLYLKIVWNTSNTGAVIDEVLLRGSSPGTAASITATLNDYGYASYCSEYPLDFSDYETADYSAWQVTGVSGETITFAQVTGTVKGGTGLILKGEPGATITLNSAASSSTLDGNLLVGTIAPTYADAGQYFGLKGNEFVPVAASTVPAGKALLPASLIAGDEVKALSFVFEDEATSLSEELRVKSEEFATAREWYTLDGRKLNNKPTQRGIYIVNGKRILF